MEHFAGSPRGFIWAKLSRTALKIVVERGRRDVCLSSRHCREQLLLTAGGRDSGVEDRHQLNVISYGSIVGIQQFLQAITIFRPETIVRWHRQDDLALEIARGRPAGRRSTGP